MKYLLLLAVPLALVSCDRASSTASGEDETDTSAAIPEVGDTMVDLAAYDLPLRLSAPDAQAAMGAALVLHPNEERGWLEVDRGEHFMLRISETEGDDLARLKEDLQRDQLRKATVITERPDLLLYKLEFPPILRWCSCTLCGRSASAAANSSLESAPETRFNEGDAWRMIGAVSPVAPSEGQGNAGSDLGDPKSGCRSGEAITFAPRCYDPDAIDPDHQPAGVLVPDRGPHAGRNDRAGG
jgi:hypothetical protein